MREEWTEYIAAVREIAKAFGVTVYCSQKYNRLNVSFDVRTPEALSSEQRRALWTIEDLIETVTDFPPGYLRQLDRPEP